MKPFWMILVYTDLHSWFLLAYHVYFKHMSTQVSLVLCCLTTWTRMNSLRLLGMYTSLPAFVFLRTPRLVFLGSNPSRTTLLTSQTWGQSWCSNSCRLTQCPAHSVPWLYHDPCVPAPNCLLSGRGSLSGREGQFFMSVSGVINVT